MTTYTCARLTTGQIVPLRQDCECRTHSGPHWLHVDQEWKASNRRLLGDEPSTLSLMGHATEERARLAELRRAMERERVAQLLTTDDLAAIRAAGEAVDISRPGLRPAIRCLLNCSLAEVERAGYGWRTYAGFLAVWEWSGIRLAGRAGAKQESFYAKHGKAAFYARINRVRTACGFPILTFTT